MYTQYRYPTDEVAESLQNFSYAEHDETISPSNWRYSYTFFVSLLVGAMAMTFIATNSKDLLSHGSFKGGVEARVANIIATNAMLPTITTATPLANKALAMNESKSVSRTSVVKAKSVVSAPLHYTAPVTAPKQDAPKTQPKRSVTGAF